ncbi:hypothetical protein Hs30E_15080 [Lactococcus hodotermopsidis]|uniref:Uncharacterized protein n=1 Tax=Pseudolactococcus hodotermopsidis TaxID=2709157 RepID=A0A6A0BGQ0_9LACT|nr:XcbB/CpsF family capsular polysaccharide biosynthesis protein [Lactococcus hodotermopsidis]GFH42957.1 hypothetical protein Hs30E_15080 [Lactococcus hodotermopsidis]
MIKEKFDNTNGIETFYEKNPVNHAKLKSYVKNGYTLDGFDEATKEFIFVPISDIKTDFECFEGIYYQLETPYQSFEVLPNNLIVHFFQHDSQEEMSAMLRYSSANGNFQSLGKQIVANTYILRIADVNLVSGSFYADTETFPDYTQKVQKLIQKIRETYNVSHDRTLMSGSSRGATGAIIHGALGGYETLAVDPILNVKYVPEHLKVRYLLFDFIPDDLSQYISSLAIATSQKIRILTSSGSGWTYGSLSELNLPNLEILDIAVPLPHREDTARHAGFINRILSYHVALINSYFYEKWTSKIDRSHVERLNNDFDIFLPNATGEIEVKKVGNYLQIYQESDVFNRLSFKLKTPLEAGKDYELLIESNAPELQFYLPEFNPFFQKPSSIIVTTDGDFVTQRYQFRAKRDFIYVGVSSFSIPRNKLVTIKSFKIREIK